jgi:hypothetical protein
MSCLRLTGRIIALFIVFTFVTVTPFLILAYDAQEAAVYGDFLDELFQDTALFEEAIPEMAQDLARELPRERETRGTPIAQLDADDWERIIYAIAPPEAMQAWSQEGLEGFRRWTRRGGGFLDDVRLPFGEARDNLINDPEQTVLRTLTQAQPACGAGEEPLDGPYSLIPQCRPSESRLPAFYERLGQEWREQPRKVWRQLWPDDLARYPDDISLAELIERESDEAELWDARVEWRAGSWGLRATRWLLTVCMGGLCAATLGLVALLAARNWREALQWTGTPIILVGVFTLLLAMPFFIGGELGTWFFSGDIPIAVQEVLENTIRAFIGDLWQSLTWQGGVLVLIGLGFWVLSFYVPGGPDWLSAPATVAPDPVDVETEEMVDVEPTEEVQAQELLDEE